MPLRGRPGAPQEAGADTDVPESKGPEVDADRAALQGRTMLHQAPIHKLHPSKQKLRPLAQPRACTVHGAGCRFVSDNGTEVDVDFAADGSELFDLWRLRQYELSLPDPFDLTAQDLRSAVRSSQPLLAEVRPGWFSVARWVYRPAP
ncbi:hypothetical protein O1L60_39415 [Streptomyces diastatochromogenes]|nr:hypothetical protein [Streptomyces diastatochromogenes]